MQCIETERIDHRVAEHVDRIRHQGRGTRYDAAAKLDHEHREIDEHHDDEHAALRSEEHTSELQSLMRISYAVFCLKKKNKQENKENRYVNKKRKKNNRQR